MPKASYQQPNFLGGEWSPLFQGRIDNPRYKTAMNLSSNGYPVAEGAWVKRSGFRFIDETDYGNAARLYPFSVNEDTPFEVELSAGIARIRAGDQLVLDGSAQLLAISASNPVQITVDGNGATWTTGDLITLSPVAGTVGFAYGSLPNQVMALTEVSSQVFTLTDPATGATIDGSQIDFSAAAGATIGHVLRITTPYEGTDWYNVKTTMVGSTMFLFNQKYPPQLLTMNGQPAGVNTSFTWSQPQLIDGPYFPVVGNGTDTGQSFDWSGYGTTTLSASTLTNGFGPNQPGGIRAQDVGRSIRILSEPQPWVVSTNYPTGTAVTLESESGNQYYRSITTAPAGFNPNLHPEYWAIDPELVFWAWGVIATVTDAATFTVTMVTQMQYDIPNQVRSFQVGILGDPVLGYPSCGCFHEGRLWMFGGTYIMGAAVDPTGLTFSPTLADETVTDASGIAYQLEAGDDNSSNILWAISNQSGIVLGSNGGEWVVQASALNDPITPTSIQAHRVTKYRCSYVKPVQTPLSIVFVQRFQRKVMEFLQDVFTLRYVAPDLTSTAKHLTTNGIEEVVYQEELTPILWARDLVGNLFGVTYRRQSSFPSEEPLFTGWHKHFHGEPGREFASLAMSPTNTDTLVDYLYTITSDASTQGTYRVERLVKEFEVLDPQLSGFFLDGGVVPCGVKDTGSGVTLYGVYPHAGQTVHVVLGGVDMGTFTVDADGNVAVPYTSTVTAAYLQSLTGNFGEASTAYTSQSGGGLNPVTSTIAQFPTSFTQATGGSGNNLGMYVSFGSNEAISIAGTIGGGTSFQLQSYSYSAVGTIPTVTATVNADVSITGPLQIAGTCWTYDGDFVTQLATSQVSQVQKYSAILAPLATMSETTDFPSAGQDDVDLSAGFVACRAGTVDLVVTIAYYATTNPGVLQVINTDLMAGLGTTGITVAGTGASPQTCYCSTGYSTADPPPAGYTSHGLVYFMEHTSSTVTTLKLLDVQPSATSWVSGFPTWASGTTYALNAEVEYGGKVWTSAEAGNVGNTPPTHWNLVNNPYITMLSVATIAPTAFDATWTHATVTDVGYDRTDSNLIVQVVTTDSVTHKQYIAKVNAANGAVLWATPISYTNFVAQLGGSRIGNGVVALITDASSGTITYYNSLTGAALSSSTIFAKAGYLTSTTGLAATDTVAGLTFFGANYDSSVSGAPAPWAGAATSFDEWGVMTIDYGVLPTYASNFIPAIVGYDYSSTTQGQLLRAGTPQDAGAANGPPQGKKRRTNQFAALFQNTQAVSIGTNFSNMRPISFTTPGGTPYTVFQMFSGVWWDQLEDDYSFDSMLAWQSNGPYPLTVVSISGFLETQDY